jgi:hypothetical protein
MDFSKISINDFKKYNKYYNRRVEQLNEFSRQIFKIEYLLYHEVKDIKSAVKITTDLPEDILNLFELIFSKNDYKHEYKKIKKRLNEDLLLLIKFSDENNIFFDKCSDTVYVNTFEKRLEDYQRKYFDYSKLNFYRFEQKNKNCFYELENSMLLNKRTKKILNNFKENKRNFWNEIASKERNKNEIILIDFDLSDTTATEKIIYLHKLGVIDFLRKQQPFQSSINSLATVLSAVTGAKSGTIQPMLNAMLGKNVEQKNNPLNSQKPVNKVIKQLNQIGFNLDETI